MSLRSFTLDDLVRRNAALHGARAAFVLDDRIVTHAEYAARVSRLAAGLANAGVGAGDRVSARPRGLARSWCLSTRGCRPRRPPT